MTMPEAMTVKHPMFNHIYPGDCRDVLKTFQPESVDLIVTSPP